MALSPPAGVNSEGAGTQASGFLCDTSEIVITYQAPVCRPRHGDRVHHAIPRHPVSVVTKCTPMQDGWHKVRLQPTPSFPFCIKHEPLGDKVTSQDDEELPQQSQGLGGAAEGDSIMSIPGLP